MSSLLAKGTHENLQEKPLMTFCFGYTRKKQPTAGQLSQLPLHTRCAPSVLSRERALLEATATFYTSENRATKMDEADVVCVYGPTKASYNKERSPGCAIGRWLSPTLANSLVGSVVTTHKRLPGWMSQMDRGFLYMVQGLHDNQLNWDEDGLSPAGERNVKEIIEVCLSRPPGSL